MYNGGAAPNTHERRGLTVWQSFVTLKAPLRARRMTP